MMPMEPLVATGGGCRGSEPVQATLPAAEVLSSDATLHPAPSESGFAQTGRIALAESGAGAETGATERMTAPRGAVAGAGFGGFLVVRDPDLQEGLLCNMQLCLRDVEGTLLGPLHVAALRSQQNRQKPKTLLLQRDSAATAPRIHELSASWVPWLDGMRLRAAGRLEESMAQLRLGTWCYRQGVAVLQGAGGGGGGGGGAGGGGGGGATGAVVSTSSGSGGGIVLKLAERAQLRHLIESAFPQRLASAPHTYALIAALHVSHGRLAFDDNAAHETGAIKGAAAERPRWLFEEMFGMMGAPLSRVSGFCQ
eukprot:jgi/Chrpa1/20312/Chrysochromulina_OHIO_Genome00021172-RA